jgi:organic radical activating enzyme
MPAGSIMNGCTGCLRTVHENDFQVWHRIIATGSDARLSTDEVAARTAGTHLHCVELWMPGGCNLRCRHCYVASRPTHPVLSESEYYRLTLHLVKEGLIDVVVPGMEPLLRHELWAVLDAARDGGARSVGLTTNATFLSKQASRLHDSALTVLNVSLDGPPEVHDRIRGRGVFEKLQEGVRVFRQISSKRLLTNTTVHNENIDCLTDIAAWGLDWGVDYAAFHPFELADQAENSLALHPSKAIGGYLCLIEAFRSGQTSSIVLEAEASTFWAVVQLARTGALDQSHLVIDEAGFLFLQLTFGDRELLVGLNFYPHHFIRTIRVADDGGLSSCRSMARTGWHGVGDLRTDPLRELICTDTATKGLRASKNGPCFA